MRVRGTLAPRPRLIFAILRSLQLLEDVDKIRDVPCTIVQGRYDVVCPMKSCWDLHRAWPEADVKVVSDAGHSMSEPGIKSELVKACDLYADL